MLKQKARLTESVTLSDPISHSMPAKKLTRMRNHPNTVANPLEIQRSLSYNTGLNSPMEQVLTCTVRSSIPDGASVFEHGSGEAHHW